MNEEVKAKLLEYMNTIESAAVEIAPEVWNAAISIVIVESFIGILGSLVAGIICIVCYKNSKKYLFIQDPKLSKDVNAASGVILGAISFSAGIAFLVKFLHFPSWLGIMYPEGEILRRAMEATIG